jgi:CRISPR-associated endonuclease/helicase Cas3
VAIAFHQCESHPGRKLTAHLENVAGRLPEGLLGTVGLFHDVGKATEYFQDHLYGRPICNPALSHHSLLGAELFLKFAWPAVAKGLIAIEELATGYSFIRRHHGALDNLIDALSVTADRAALTRQLGSLDVAGLTEWLQGRGLNFVVDAQPNHAELRVRTLQALRTVAEVQPAMARFQKALLAFGSLIEADRDAAAGFTEDAFRAAAIPFFFDHVKGFRSRLDASQVSPALATERECLFLEVTGTGGSSSERTAGLWTLTAPTGSGKTLAALGWAFQRRAARVARGGGHCRVVYALPFTSIIDQTVAVLEQMHESSVDESILAVHHHQAEPRAMAMRGEDSLARIWTEGWRADVVCTTFVQIANALFHGTPADSRRFKNLAGGILILDEVQAIPVHLWRPFAEALTSLCKNSGTDVLLMTATQPALFARGVATEIAPQNYNCRPAFDRYDVQVDLVKQVELDAFANDIVRELRSDEIQSCLVILNTVREALDLFDRLSEHPCGTTLLHLSTNLRPKDRRNILHLIRSRSHRRVLLISTQVVEAGVDLTFDIVFRALAPLDSIIQAAGRCNRHASGRRGVVRVLEPAGGSAARIYGNVHIDVARAFLGKDPHTFTEPELRSLVDEYYSTLKERTSSRKSGLILEAVRMMEFANLRGDGIKDADRDKRVLLIEEDADRVPHYIETDEDDSNIWERFQNAVNTKDRRAIRRLRSQVAQRIVEVPARFALTTNPDTATGLVHVARDAATRVYNAVTGWRR